MKINAIKSQKNKSDILEFIGNVLKINGKDYDLDNLPSSVQPTEENPEPDNTQFYLDNQCYTDLQGIDQLKLYVNFEHQFLFVNNNYLLFHDKDLNGEIDMTELEELIDTYNLTEPARRAVHRAYRDSFTPQEWKKRMETCNPKR